MIPKPRTYRDKAYLLHLRDEPCELTGEHSSDHEKVEACHIGRSAGGMGMKTSDYDTLPLMHGLHALQHQHGENTFWNGQMQMTMHFVQAYARMRYLRYLTGVETDQELIERIRDDQRKS